MTSAVPSSLRRAGLLLVCLLAATPALGARRGPIEVLGRLEVVQVDDFTGGGPRRIHRVKDRATGHRFELDLPGDAPELRTGM
ncbi:MAG TPA: hypothetical protein VKA21_05585, partial [Candidatus Binatia bacterium]|nr:hypothetical protein [Candidatus Binatia bacterium]